jgi:hypothetical protein
LESAASRCPICRTRFRIKRHLSAVL